MSEELNDRIKNCVSCQQVIEHGVREDKGNHTCGRDAETIKRMIGLFETKDLIESGYGGISKKGAIVDRRKVNDAVPFQQNSLFNTPKPKDI